MRTKTTLLSAVLGLTTALAMGQVTIFSDNFNVSQGSTFSTAGVIGTSDWSVARSGNDWGARIDGGILTLTNTASAAANADGWVFANTSLTSSGPFNTTLSQSGGPVTWSFNMQQIRTNPAGFSSNSYGVAFILGSTSTNIATEGSGYAVVLGNTGTPDPLRLISFTGGIQSLGTATGGIITASAPLDNPTVSHMSISVVFDPANNQWSMFGRNDGASFADPLSGNLTLLGTGTDTTHTSTDLLHMGAYWQGSTAGNQLSTFDNFALTAIPEPSTVALLGIASVILYGKLRRHKG